MQRTVACSCTLYAEFDASLYSTYIVLISNHKQPLYSDTKSSAQKIGIITLYRSLRTSSLSRGSEWGGPLVGCRLKLSNFVGSRLKFSIFVGSRLDF